MGPLLRPLDFAPENGGGRAKSFFIFFYEKGFTPLFRRRGLKPPQRSCGGGASKKAAEPDGSTKRGLAFLLSSIPVPVVGSGASSTASPPLRRTQRVRRGEVGLKKATEHLATTG